MMNMQQIEDNNRNIRREVLLRNVMHALRATVRVRPVAADESITDAYVEFTDASAQVLAPFVEAVDILEAIIWASDGCMGHRHCAHSMEPWQRARALLEGKWQAHADCEPWPKEPSR